MSFYESYGDLVLFFHFFTIFHLLVSCFFSGSGKTYTMEGDKANGQYGISQRTIQKIFNLLQDRAQQHQSNCATQDVESNSPQFEYNIEVGMLEIYNDEGKRWHFIVHTRFSSESSFYLLCLRITLQCNIVFMRFCVASLFSVRPPLP